MRNGSGDLSEYARRSGLVVTYGDTIVPEGNIILLPLKTDMELLCCGNDLVEIPNDGITFCLWDADDLGDEAWVEEQRLPAGDRVCTNEWMLCNDRIATHRAT